MQVHQTTSIRHPCEGSFLLVLQPTRISSSPAQLLALFVWRLAFVWLIVSSATPSTSSTSDAPGIIRDTNLNFLPRTLLHMLVPRFYLIPNGGINVAFLELFSRPKHQNTLSRKGHVNRSYPLFHPLYDCELADLRLW